MAGCSSPAPSTPPGQFGQRLQPHIYPKYIPASDISPKPASPHGLSSVPCVPEGARDMPFQYHLGENVFNPHGEASMLPDRLWLEKSEFAFQNFFFFFFKFLKLKEIKYKLCNLRPPVVLAFGIPMVYYVPGGVSFLTLELLVAPLMNFTACPITPCMRPCWNQD